MSAAAAAAPLRYDHETTQSNAGYVSQLCKSLRMYARSQERQLKHSDAGSAFRSKEHQHRSLLYQLDCACSCSVCSPLVSNARHEVEELFSALY